MRGEYLQLETGKERLKSIVCKYHGSSEVSGEYLHLKLAKKKSKVYCLYHGFTVRVRWDRGVDISATATRNWKRKVRSL